MIIDTVKSNIPIKDFIHNSNKKVAVFFRGPIRPDVETVATHTSTLINELKSYGFQVDSYLITWMNNKNANVNDLLLMNLYDNVIIQQNPKEEQIRRCTKKDAYGGISNC